MWDQFSQLSTSSLGLIPAPHLADLSGNGTLMVVKHDMSPTLVFPSESSGELYNMLMAGLATHQWSRAFCGQAQAF